MRFKAKVVVVTGAASGIGRGTAVLFGKEGAKVVVSDVAREGGEATVKQIKDVGGEAVFVFADVSKVDDVKNLFETTVNKYGRIDVLFNNAGIALPSRPVHEYTEEEWDRLMDINLKGPFLCSKYAIPYMIKQGGGAIVNTASVLSFAAYPNYSIYNASKRGLLLLTRTMAVDLAPYNIRVNCVCPGVIDTELIRRQIEASPDPQSTIKIYEDVHPIRRLGEPEDVGRAVLFLASDEASWITGTDLSVDGGMRARSRSLHDLQS